MNKVRLTEEQLKKMISESVRQIMKEGFGPTSDFELSYDFANMVSELKERAMQLEGFINEFPKFVQIMQEQTQKYGLVLKNASTDDSFDIDDVARGGNKVFEYDYRLANVNFDVYSISDEEYDQLNQKLEEICDNMSVYLNSRDFKFGQLNLSTNDSGIDITFEFNFWA